MSDPELVGTLVAERCVHLWNVKRTNEATIVFASFFLNPCPALLSTVCANDNRFRIIRRIGGGSFGEIYMGIGPNLIEVRWCVCV